MSENESVTVAEIVLPWPERDLSPNSRVHWRKLAEAKKRAKSYGYIAAKKAGFHTVEWPEGRLYVWINYHPPTRRRYDMDNLIASCKGQFDGIADAMGVDDSRFVFHPFVHSEPVKHGLIKIRITGGRDR